MRRGRRPLRPYGAPYRDAFVPVARSVSGFRELRRGGSRSHERACISGNVHAASGVYTSMSRPIFPRRRPRTRPVLATLLAPLLAASAAVARAQDSTAALPPTPLQQPRPLPAPLPIPVQPTRGDTVYLSV